MLPTFLLIGLRLLTVLKTPNSRPWRAAFFRPIVEAVLHVVLCDGKTQSDAVRHRTLGNLIQLVYRIIQLLLAINTHRTKSSDRRALVDAAVRYGSLDWLQCSYLYRSACLYFPRPSRLRYAGPFPSFIFVLCWYLFLLESVSVTSFSSPICLPAFRPRYSIDTIYFTYLFSISSSISTPWSAILGLYFNYKHVSLVLESYFLCSCYRIYLSDFTLSTMPLRSDHSLRYFLVLLFVP